MIRFPKIVLASGSPRRKSLLEENGFEFEVVIPDDHAETKPNQNENSILFVHRMAYAKAANVAAKFDDGIFVAADTVAHCDGKILGKPENREHAFEMLSTMSGQSHFVHTGVCVWNRPTNHCITRVATTKLTMDPLSPNQIQTILDSNLWEGKAGAFGYQDGLDWVHITEGTESNVVGLPIEMLKEML